jgi:predicted enzyme related to lactoylglutathione lyase
MLRGFALVNIYADDLDAAKRWYEELLGIDPYFERPGYYEFRVGDYEHELGIVDRRFAPPGGADRPGGAIAYWHVDDLEAALDRALSLGATEYQPLTEWGSSGFTTASVVDPFGNVLGLMRNPHYVEVLGRSRPQASSG